MILLTNDYKEDIEDHEGLGTGRQHRFEQGNWDCLLAEARIAAYRAQAHSLVIVDPASLV